MVTVSPSFSQVESITREELLQRVLRESKVGGYGVATGGGTTTVVDTGKLQSSQFNAQEWVGGWVRIVTTTDAAAPVGEIRTVTTYAPATGTITVDPAFSANLTAGDTYELWKYPHPQDVLDMIDTLMREDIWLPSWATLSEVPDGDMEQSGVSDWTDTNASSVKVTSEPALSGERWLEVTASSAGGYSSTFSFGVEPGGSYYTGALVMPIGAYTGELVAYDVTNSVNIKSVTSDRRYINGVGFDFTVPATCYQIALHLVGQEINSVVRWDDIMLWGYNAPDIALPWWVKNKDQVKGIFRFERWQAGNTTRFPRLTRGINGQYGYYDDSFGRDQLRLFRSSGQMPLPIMIMGTRNPTAFSDDTSAKRIDENYLFTCVMYRLFSMLDNNPASAKLNREWLQSKLRDWRNDWLMVSYQQAERIEQVLQGPDRTALYS